MKNSTSSLYLPISLSVETWKIFKNMLCQLFFRLSWHFQQEKPVFWKASFLQNKGWLLTRTSFVCKTLRLVRISLLTNALNKSVLLFFSGKLFYKSNRKLFSCEFAYPDVNTWGVGRILNSYTNPQLCLRFAELSRILPTPLMFISGYANMENVFYCLIGSMLKEWDNYNTFVSFFHKCCSGITVLGTWHLVNKFVLNSLLCSAWLSLPKLAENLHWIKFKSRGVVITHPYFVRRSIAWQDKEAALRGRLRCRVATVIGV